MSAKPPNNLGKVIDRLDRLREELLSIQRWLEKWEKSRNPGNKKSK